MNTSESPTSDAESDEGSGALPHMSKRSIVWVSIGLAALIGIAAWFGWGMASDPVRWRDVGFEVPSATEATATYDVFLYTDRAVVCHVRALNDRFAEVGVAVQEVNPAAGAEQRMVTEIATTEQATTAVVNYCEPAQDSSAG